MYISGWAASEPVTHNLNLLNLHVCIGSTSSSSGSGSDICSGSTQRFKDPAQNIFKVCPLAMLNLKEINDSRKISPLGLNGYNIFFFWKGNPYPTITWWNNRRLVTGSARLKLSNGGQHLRIQVKHRSWIFKSFSDAAADAADDSTANATHKIAFFK